jgi:hypothetical protein
MSSILGQAVRTPAQETNVDPAVFLGGTANGSTWRDQLIPLLEVSYFNPIVQDWTAEDKRREEQARAACKVQAYVISPKMKGFFSIAELVRDAMAARKPVVYCFLIEDAGEKFDNHQSDSIIAIENMLADYGMAHMAHDLQEVASLCNELVGSNGKEKITPA